MKFSTVRERCGDGGVDIASRASAQTHYEISSSSAAGLRYGKVVHNEFAFLSLPLLSAPFSILLSVLLLSRRSQGSVSSTYHHTTKIFGFLDVSLDASYVRMLAHPVFLLSFVPLIQAQETVLGAYIFHRHGDRTSKSWPPVLLTDLGYTQVHASGD
jgi:hypothetical protein